MMKIAAERSPRPRPGISVLTASALFVLTVALATFPAAPRDVAALAPASLSAKEAAQPDIILIVVDALRPDHLGCYGYGLPTSPTIDRLAERGILCETAISQASWTKASFACLVTSRYPFQTGVTDWFSVLPDTVVTMQEVLAANGYETICVINMVGLADKYRVLKGFAKTDVAGKNARRDSQTTDAAIALMADARGPFLALVHYFGAHDPYRPSGESRQMFALDLPAADSETPGGATRDDSADDSTYLAGDTDQQDAAPTSFDARLYDACIRDVDGEIQRIVTFLEERGLAENTVMIITADHGEAFREHGRFSHGWSLFDEEIKIPLVIHFPKRYPQGNRVALQVRSIDIFPTILDLAGIDAPAGLEGRSIVAPAGVSAEEPRGERSHDGDPAFKPFFPPEVAYCETSMRKAVPNLKAIRTLERKAVVEPPTGLISIYDLKADPRERDDLWPDRVDSRDPLLKMLSTVPGFSAKGWRLAFTGAGHKDAIDVTVSLPAGARIVQAEKMASRGRFDVDLAADRRSMRVVGAARDLDLLIFDVEPEDAELDVTVKAGGTPATGVYVGRRAQQHLGEPFRTAAKTALGIPDAFEECRRAHTPAAFIWWAPGQKMQTSAPAASLTPEEEKRLRSLGYIQ